MVQYERTSSRRTLTLPPRYYASLSSGIAWALRTDLVTEPGKAAEPALALLAMYFLQWLLPVYGSEVSWMNKFLAFDLGACDFGLLRRLLETNSMLISDSNSATAYNPVRPASKGLHHAPTSLKPQSTPPLSRKLHRPRNEDLSRFQVLPPENQL